MNRRRPILRAPILLPLGATRTVPRSPTLDLPRLRRLAACLVALALPAIGIAAAGTVQRAGPAGTRQAAAARSPLNGAASDGPSRTAGTVREALLLPRQDRHQDRRQDPRR